MRRLLGIAVIVNPINTILRQLCFTDPPSPPFCIKHNGDDEPEDLLSTSFAPINIKGARYASSS